jgi:hypothetical protein
MKTIIDDDKREFLDNVKLPKEDKEFISANVITFSGMEKIFNGETNYDHNQSKLLIQQYLFQKNYMIRRNFKNLEREIEKFNKAVDMAKQLDIKKSLNGIPLNKIKMEISEVV